MGLFDQIKGKFAPPKGTQESQLLLDLRQALGSERVHFDGATRALLSRDASVFEGGAAGPVCYPVSTSEVQAVVTIAASHDSAVVPRGGGTGLTGGAIPLGQPVVVACNKMNRVLEIDVENRVAWVEPGVINLDLSKQLEPLGFHFAPDPSSQQVCTIGGNVANNAGGPHCLAHGVTDAHVLAVEVVLPSGEVVMLGDLTDEPCGYDLRGAFIGSEGTMGIATKVAVRLSKTPPEVRTLLLSFGSIRDAALTVSATIASGIVPAALEVMDQQITRAVENFVHAGYPLDAGAILLAEVEGLASGVDADVQRISDIARQHNATNVRVATSKTERALLWKGRKNALGALAQIQPDYYLHDTVVPRSKLAELLDVVDQVSQKYDLTIMNVFHAGDGNLHPFIAYDVRVDGILERVHAAGKEILEASVAVGGVLTGEHGVGIEKRDYMAAMFSDADLDHQNRLRQAFDPHCRANPGKVLPAGHSCADIQALNNIPTGVWG